MKVLGDINQIALLCFRCKECNGILKFNSKTTFEGLALSRPQQANPIKAGMVFPESDRHLICRH